MCGFLTYFGDSLEDNQIFNLEKGIKLLKHRGPDNQKKEILFDRKCFLAHTRLNIQDNDINSNQPFYSSNGRYVLLFNGEIYNHRKLRKLYFSNFNFKTKSDTETLVELWNIYGEDGGFQSRRYRVIFSRKIKDCLKISTRQYSSAIYCR